MKISINLGISSAFASIILILTIALCAVIYWTLRETLRDDLQKQIYNTLRVAAVSIDGSLFPGLKDPEQETSPEYLTAKKSLQVVQKQISDIRFVYTMRFNEKGEPIFVVDAEDDPKTMSHIGDVYDKPTPKLLEALNSKKPGETFIEREPSPDEWGTWLSGFIVLGDKSGKATGILGMDVSAATIQAYEFKVLSIMSSVAGGVSILVLILGFVISRRITVPLKAIAADMERIQRFQIDDQVLVKSVFSEIRLMNVAIGDMKNSLRAFKRYVPADLVAELITLHKEAKLGGERRDLTVLFSDIEGFTTWSEKLPPEQLIQLMARYFSGMTEIILRNKGTVDKYIGDAIMAFWGAPSPLEGHALHACRAALECTQFQNRFNLEMKAEGLPTINTRIGINTGEVLVGNVGYEERLNYTVIGDDVNLASRLESLNKMYGTKIIVSENTKSRLDETFLTRPIDCVVVKGKTEPIAIHELVAVGDITDNLKKYADFSVRAFELYLKRDWAASKQAYEKILGIRDQDGPARVLSERCDKYLKEAPGPDWKGAIILHEK